MLGLTEETGYFLTAPLTENEISCSQNCQQSGKCPDYTVSSCIAEMIGKVEYIVVMLHCQVFHYSLTLDL